MTNLMALPPGQMRRSNAFGHGIDEADDDNEDEDSEITRTPVVPISAGETAEAEEASCAAEDALPNVAEVDNEPRPLTIGEQRKQAEFLGERVAKWLTKFPEALPIRRDSWLSVGGGIDVQVELLRVSNDDFQEAALRGDMGLVRRLVFCGASVNAPMRPEDDDDFMTLLHVLAAKPEIPNNGQILAEIILMRANLDARSSSGTTPLIMACRHKNIDAIEALLASGADERPVDDGGHTALWYGASRSADCLDTQESCEEVVNLFGRYEANLDEGGDTIPIIQAVKEHNFPTVQAFIQNGAQPKGLHEAVEDGPLDIIEALVAAEANPFTKDASGKTVMDLALARGDIDILTLLRNFVGDLQRNQHPHLQTLEEDMLAAALDDSNFGVDTRARPSDNRRKTCLGGQSHRGQASIMVENPQIQRLRLCIQSICRKIFRHRCFQISMFIALVCALFLPDLWVMADIPTNDTLDAFLICILCAFIIEFLVQVGALWKNYVFNFFFWMDIVGCLSVPLDHSMVVEALPETLDNAVVMRAARMAKLGARAGRFTKLVKLLRFLPGMQPAVGVGTAKVIANVLNMAISTRVSCLIIALVMLLPAFGFFTYPENDYSMKAYLNSMQQVAIEYNDAAGVSDLLSDFNDFYKDKHYYPLKVTYVWTDGSTLVHDFGNAVPARDRNIVRVQSDSGNYVAELSFQTPNQLDAALNTALIFTIMFIMMGSGLVMSNSVSAIVLVPLEKLLNKVKSIASTIFQRVAAMDKKLKKDQGEDISELEGDMEDENALVTETHLLETVLKKLTALSEITVKKTSIDSENFDALSENDKAVLQGFTSHQIAPIIATMEASEDDDEQSEALIDIMEQHLVNADIDWEDFEMWEMNILELSREQLATLSFCILTYYYGHGFPVTDEWQETCVKFLDGVAKRDFRVPYHMLAHGVQAMFSTYRLLQICATEHWLNMYERFALIVGSLCHDLAHPGLTNNFLIEVGHELAVLYNDHSPLENMHCAQLFELVGMPESNIFAALSKPQYRTVRQVCIEAILQTDQVHSFGMVKDIENLYGMNRELFDISEESYKTHVIEFPSKEVVDFFRGADVKKQLRVTFLPISSVIFALKPWRQCEKWAYIMLEEFFLQGDKEKELGLTVQPLNDRDKVNKAYSQIAFTELVVAPLAFSMAKVMPSMDFAMEYLGDNLTNWIDKWVDSADPEEEEEERVRERAAKLRPNLKIAQ